jgi:hypothetical protein
LYNNNSIEQKINSMIRANELRIGNLVKWSNKFHVVQDILSPDMDFINGCIVTNYFDAGRGLEEFEPIPLTSEVLEGWCGFDTGMGSDYKLQDLRLRLWKNNDWILLNTNGSDLYPRMPLIKHLHQLQNLYFPLTGKELNFEVPNKEQNAQECDATGDASST